MPIYEFEYTDELGQRRVVEQFHSMNDAPQEIQVHVGDAVYTAHRIMSAHANMASDWAKGREDAGLPPVDYIPPEDRA